MQPLRFLSIFALSVAVRADSNTVLADIDKLSNTLTTLSDSVKVVTPGIPGLPFALQVQADAVNLDNIIVASTQDANTSAPFGNGSLQVGLALVNLQPKVSSSLSSISEKNTTFGGLGVIVLASLLQLKRGTIALSDQIVAKLGPLEAAIAPPVVNSITDAFDGAIASYQSNSLA